MKKLAIGLLFTFLTFSLNEGAIAETYKIDNAHSNVTFKVGHLGITKVPGRFNKFEGIINFDDFFTEPKEIKNANTNVSIDLSSVDTGIKKRDEHLKSKDFFNVADYPEMKFESEKIKVTGDKTFDIIGNLTLHGVTQPVVLKAKYNGKAVSPFDGVEKVAFTADTKINRKDYGLTWNKQLEAGGFLVGEEVEIYLEIEADKK
ncbi:MAG: YceI family protein [Candidatus Caenarcaniphilales bacterium]|nr:YceI family protein [Candidatus Caenarcaniphilales bacterium]